MMMFSNFGSPFGDDGLDAIIDGIKNLETNFTVVYVWTFSYYPNVVLHQLCNRLTKCPTQPDWSERSNC